MITSYTTRGLLQKSRWSQDSREGLVVCDQCEATALDVLVELTNTRDQ